ncbi:basic phospholipase A2 caudoxin-like [Lingula anatina]|uniref:Phospholipase A2 n=1 Tax=Lingula anatina TaxID=7574 RepID=A0A1S3K0S8_LINAN|nr:basic phospholipase A2 caudoxin-like [Lingula anatina]|eukprot:XP_013415886.1 basic phospholipase A2 caudoxin-like [Lingula anatina]
MVSRAECITGSVFTSMQANRLGLVFLVVLGSSALALPANRLHKRRLDEFGVMITLLTGRGALDYDEYGNWCGPGGDGETVDDIDECCKSHDNCYERIGHNECHMRFVPEDFRTYLTHYGYKVGSSNSIICTDDPVKNACKRSLCECDREGAMCFARFKDAYNSDNRKDSLIGK